MTLPRIETGASRLVAPPTPWIRLSGWLLGYELTNKDNFLKRIQIGAGAHRTSYFKITGDPFVRDQNGRDVKLATHIHLVCRLRTRGAFSSSHLICFNVIHMDDFT